MKRAALAFVILIASICASLAQGSVTVIGPITPGDCAFFNSTTVLKDAGFNCNGAPGNAITALTGDGTAAGPGSVPLTLATVNVNVGSFGSATQCIITTQNAKGLTTAISAVTCTPAFASITGIATLAQLPQGIANSIYINPTGGAAAMQNIAVPACANDGVHALVYINASGLQCASLAFPVSLANGGLGGSQAAATAGQVPVYPGSGGAAVPTTLNAGSLDNFLPNVQWQLWSGVTFGIKNNAAGTGSQSTVSCSAFTISNANPTFTCANTQTLRTGDLAILSTVSFWGFAGAGFITCVQVNCTPGEQALGSYVTGVRIGAIVANTSVNIPNPGFSGVSPAASTAINIVPIAPGDLAGTGSNGPTGWTKSTSLIATIDDWGAAATPASTVYPGCERPLLLRKGITGQEIFEASVPPDMIKKFAGQTVTFGAAVYQRVQGGASTWNLHIDDTGGSNASSNGTGSGLGGYQFLSVTRTISQTATAIVFYVNLLGNVGDVFDVCLPTAAFVPSMAQYQLHQNSSECISSRHWNPPLLDPFIITFPSSALVAGLWGWNGIDLEAISFGTVHNTVQYVVGDLEWTSNNVATPANPSTVFFGSNTANLNFGIKAGTIVNGTTFSTSATSVPLWTDGTVAFLTGVTALVPTNGTFDFWDVCVSPGSWNN